MVNTELDILWASLLAMAAGVFVYWAVKFHVVRTIAKWLGRKMGVIK